MTTPSEARPAPPTSGPLRALLDATPDAMLVTDEGGRIVLANVEAERVFGWPAGTLEGQAIEALLPDRLRGAHVAHRAAYALQPRPRRMSQGRELLARRHDGSEFAAQINLSPWHTAAGRWSITVVRDLSEWQPVAAARGLLESAQGEIRLRDEFLAVAAHELRTPLAVLTLQVQLLQRQVRALGGHGEPERRLADSVLKADRSTTRLTTLVGTLLDLSQVLGGGLVLHEEEVDLARLARGVIEDFRELGRRAGCEVRLTGDDAIPGRWDPVRLEQVLLNLLNNAVKYGDAKPVDVEVRGHEAGARVTVRDHGLGVSAGDGERIFGRFQRGVSADHFGGLGLGLFVSRHIAEAHGGQLTLERSADRGSRFTLELPRERGGFAAAHD